MNQRSTAKKRFLTLLPISLLLLLPSASGFIVPAMERPLSMYPAAAPDGVFSGHFSVLTYNIAGLPELISSATTKRAPSISEIGRRINAYDIVNVQEDFNYNQSLYQNGNTHPYRTRSKGAVPFGDGLNTLSKFPVHHMHRVAWNHCTGADCFTPKGFSYARVEISKNTFIDLYNVHANAYNHQRAAEARRNNIIQLSEFIKINSKGHAVVIMGDLNAHYSYQYDNVRLLLKDNDLNDAWAELTQNNLLPVAKKELPESKILNTAEFDESIDKILYRSNEEITLIPSSYILEKQLFNDQSGTPLSDHHPVSLLFSWTLKQKPVLQNILAEAR